MLYVEVDTNEMNEWKSQTLRKLEEEGKLPDHVCSRKLVTMDFSKECVKDLPNHGVEFGDTKKTCWILEGLIMYLDPDAVVSLLTEISNVTPLSSSGSPIVLNFSNTQISKEHHSDEFCRSLLVNKLDWRLDRTTFFGDEDFAFRRYPPGKPAKKHLGFAFYSRP